jgi:hypothetical protein
MEAHHVQRRGREEDRGGLGQGAMGADTALAAGLLAAVIIYTWLRRRKVNCRT